MESRLEREVKLRFPSASAARTAVARLGASPLRPRRLQRDALLDTPSGALRDRRSALRLRSEDGRHWITYKGPPQPATMKLREELEAGIDQGDVVLEILQRLGYRVTFRYEKYREELALEDVVVAIDETPIGTFVELEGTEAAITAAAAALGYTPADYVTESYRGLFFHHRRRHALAEADMTFRDRP